MSPPDASAKLLLFAAEEMLIHVVCSFDHGNNRTIVVADHRMPKELSLVFEKVLEDDGVGRSRLGFEVWAPKYRRAA